MAYVGSQRLHHTIPGRLIAVRRSKRATEKARKALQQRASKRQKSISAEALEAAQYFFLWTTLSSSWSRLQALDLYRSRWQIELSFKRMKSIMGLGHLPKKDPASCRAWLHGKLLTSLLIERMIGAQKRFPPGDISWAHRRSRWRESEYMLREILAAFFPLQGLVNTLTHWSESLNDLPIPRGRENAIFLSKRLCGAAPLRMTSARCDQRTIRTW